MIDFNKFTDTAYLFDPNPPAQSQLLLLLMIIFGVMLVLVVVLQLLLKNPLYYKLKKGLSSLFLTTGITGFFLLFFRWQGLPYLSSRFLLLLLILIVIIWFVLILIYLFRKFPDEKRQFIEKLRLQKYLPQPRADKMKKGNNG